jgi:hypothetical protein
MFLDTPGVVYADYASVLGQTIMTACVVGAFLRVIFSVIGDDSRRD